MSEPTNSEITRALAKMADEAPIVPEYFSPLTDWRDLGPLIEKYGVWIGYRFGQWTCATPVDDGLNFENGMVSADLKRAACLALYALAQEQSAE